MPVLEVTQLQVKGVFANDPQLLQSLSDVRDKLQTNSHFYTCIEDPTKLYILGTWRDLEQHLDFLASPTRDEVLGPQEDMLDFQWTVHLEIDSISVLPLDAPVLALERLRIEADGSVAFDQAATKHVQRLQGSHKCKAAYGWRCDAVPGRHEAIIFSGWENAQAHVSFRARQQDNGDYECAAAFGKYEELLVHRATNLEREAA
jgi:heme-degrading monooxygenase HmoA